MSESVWPASLEQYQSEIQAVSTDCVVGEVTSDRTTSYLGGLPTIDADFDWPLKDGRALEFIGQIACSEIEMIPTDSGNLLFFYDRRHWGADKSDQGHAVVLHQLGDYQADALDLPKSEEHTWFGLRKRASRPKVYERLFIDFTKRKSYPSWERNLVNIGDEAALESYIVFCEQHDWPIQLGGFPAPIQSDRMEVECAGLVGLGPADDWVLLLQLAEVGDMMWGDAGLLYWFIHRRDLAECRFDRVWMIMQSH